ncbi:MAG: hypothetical protein J1D88_07830, partial [Treponema sp.]|nr:hypothetical protein [Treponema sp.]
MAERGALPTRIICSAKPLYHNTIQEKPYGKQHNQLRPAREPLDRRPRRLHGSQPAVAHRVCHSVSTRSVRHIAAYQKLEVEVYKDIIANGGHLNTPLINTSFSITGVFANMADSFDKTRHAVKLNVNAGSALREA